MFDKFKLMVSRLFDSITITDLQLDGSLPEVQFFIDGSAIPFRLDWKKNGGALMIYFRDDIRSKILTKQRC